MADGAPLLLLHDQPNLAVQESAKPEDKSNSSLDELIEQCTGGFGWSQLIQSILVSLPRAFDGQQTFISVYTDAEPTWHCLASDTTTAITCESLSSLCNLPKSAWSWDGPASKSIISQWGLECASPFIKGLPASSYFMGSVLGLFILASLADSSLGRKKLLFLSCLLMSIASLSTTFSTNIWLYSALKFVCGIGRASIGTCSLVLVNEMVGRHWRGIVSVVGFLFFTLGYLSLPMIAYILRGSSWKSMYSWTSLPAILYSALFLFLVNESPRWLFMQGRHEEAVEVLKSIGLANDLRRLREIGKDSSKATATTDNPNISNDNLFYSSLKKLFERKWAVKRVLLVMVLGFGIGMVYVGMPLGVGSFGFNIYLSVMFNALLEIPSYGVTIFLLEKCHRRASLLGFCTLSGALSIAICLVGGDNDSNGGKGGAAPMSMLKIWIEIASLFCGVTAFNVLLAYTVELFPTCVRNSATSMASQALNLGAVFSPMLVSAGSHNGSTFLSFGVFGFVIICCGLFVVCLPETRGALLCETMDEQEQYELPTLEC